MGAGGGFAAFSEGRSRMTAKQLPDDTYLDKIYTMLAQIEQEEGAAMDAAARGVCVQTAAACCTCFPRAIPT